MDKKILSEQALYYGDLKMPQGFEINSFKLCEDIFKHIYFREEFSFSREWEKLNNYIKDFFYLKHKINLVNKESKGSIYYPNQTSQPIHDVDPVDLRNSPDFTMLYGVHTKNCYVKFYYEDNRKKGRDWTIELKQNKYIIFPSTNKYIIINHQKQLLNFIQTITYEGI
jgi:hypothetical protein